MKYSSRFFLYAPLVLLLGLAAFAGVHWWLAATALDKRLIAMNGHEAVPGVTLRFSSRTIGGFPFRLDVVFKNLEVEVATPHGPARWQSEDFAMHALTYGRALVIFEAAGKQSLSWHGLDGTLHKMPFVPGSLHASAIEDTQGLSRFDLDIVDFNSPNFSAMRLQFDIRHDPARPALDLAASLDDFRSPSRSVLGRAITSLRLTGTMAPQTTFDSLRAGKQDWPDAVEAWRKGGGNLHVDQIDIAWDKLNAHGSGTLFLDEMHRPSGMLDFKIANMMALLVRNDVLPGPDKGIASGLTDRAAKAGANDSGLMGVVIGFKDGTVYVGDESADTIAPLY
jgi:hypothetical protein